MSTADKIAFVNLLSAARLAGHRGLGVRQPEVGAADGRRRRGVRRHRAAARASATPRSCRTWRASTGRPRPASPTSRSSPPSTETFSRKNINQSIDESLRHLRGGLRARAARRACASAATCPPRSAVRTKVRCHPTIGAPTLTERLLDLGVYEVAVSDTIGIAHPGQVRQVLEPRARARARASVWRCTFTTRAAPRSPTSWRRCRWESRPSMRRRADWAAVRTRRAPPATWPPTI